MNKTEIMTELDRLIQQPQISEDELKILKELKAKYQNNDNLSQIAHGIKSSLTPLAIQGKLSKESVSLFKHLAQNNFWNKGAGVSPFSM
ncbi:bacteriocin immunity protein [Lactococcus petauri]|uniref:Bacteriocin immunity protein n=1 Tax=Lactococcus petauri TaxID=1940789 RepID=A0AAJ2J1A9_9LACT|nr:bacteriocin immunity protein [Lactococcus petauri]MDT2528072.1 bacteriocin immunity protein [Lactococcus petauri]MDT2561347.1 bacteriocin immunity protein [Lactococcus petauri]MDT2586706.1 bacteriocin immunity protein [Lactococcus petauri]MDT2667736.1 bacteriocin immunity protein [Lactococcus petauri]